MSLHICKTRGVLTSFVQIAYKRSPEVNLFNDTQCLQDCAYHYSTHSFQQNSMFGAPEQSTPSALAALAFNLLQSAQNCKDGNEGGPICMCKKHKLSIVTKLPEESLVQYNPEALPTLNKTIIMMLVYSSWTMLQPSTKDKTRSAQLR